MLRQDLGRSSNYHSEQNFQKGSTPRHIYTKDATSDTDLNPGTAPLSILNQKSNGVQNSRFMKAGNSSLDK